MRVERESKMRRLKCYLASGWFNPEQKKQMDEVYDILKRGNESGYWDYFAPFYDGIVLKKEDPDLRRRMELVWWLDIEQLKTCDLVVVCTQDHDVGTIFEAGFASALGKTVFCYNSKPELGLNLMLAQESRCFAKTPENLKTALLNFNSVHSSGDDLSDYRFNKWEGDPI